MATRRRKLAGPDGKPVQVNAVHANRGVEAWYRKQLQCILERCANSMLVHLQAVYRATPPTTGFAQDAKTPTAQLNRALKKWGGLWQRKFDRMSLDLARKFAKKSFATTDRSFNAALKASGFTVEFSPTKKSVENYHAVVAENVGLIKSIPQEFLKDVQTSVWQSVMKGGDMGGLRKEIQAKYGVSHRRASFIARDQNNKAKAVLENTRRQELGIVEAIWRHSGGGKVPRPHHVEWGQKKLVFKLADGVYDPKAKKNVWPGTEPNCRCTSKSIIPGFD